MATASSRVAALALLVSVAGCAPNPPTLGEALKYDMALQTIDPDPVYPADAADAGTNGDVARSAAERYRKGTVKPLESISTTSAVNDNNSGSK